MREVGHLSDCSADGCSSLLAERRWDDDDEVAAALEWMMGVLLKAWQACGADRRRKEAAYPAAHMADMDGAKRMALLMLNVYWSKPGQSYGSLCLWR